MRTKISLNRLLARDAVVVIDCSIGFEVERHLCAIFPPNEEDRRFSKRVCVPEFIEDIWISCTNLGNDGVACKDLSLDVVENYAGSLNFVDTKYLKAEFIFCDRLDYILIEAIEGFCKWHDDKYARLSTF